MSIFHYSLLNISYSARHWGCCNKQQKAGSCFFAVIVVMDIGQKPTNTKNEIITDHVKNKGLKYSKSEGQKTHPSRNEEIFPKRDGKPER